MKLRHLRLHGFKSFADATKVDFHDGVTAIVGPNGCGKSNISDAIRWVLGEQRPSAIRGGKMEEAIFQGSVNRRPVNRGSVALTVSNEDGSLPVAFNEVEIGRTVYRDGGSEYTVNRSVVRLRDVVDLYRDTGLGANAYSVIESRMIDAILSDRAEERRSLFEEASGVGKYKDRRKAATRRLERAEIDVQRLEDVIAEVQTKVRSLARQKGRAQRYLELRARRLDVEVTVARHQMEHLEQRRVELEKALSEGGSSGEVFQAELTTTEAEYETLRARAVDAEKGRAAAAAELERIRSDLVRWERDLAVAAEREAYANRRLDQIAEEQAEAESRLEAQASELTGLESQRERQSVEFDEAKQALDEKRRAAESVQGSLAEARAEVDALEERERQIARTTGLLEGDREAAEAQAADLADRLERLRTEIEGAASLVAELQSQGDLFTDQLQSLSGRSESLKAEVTSLEGQVTAAREALREARDEEMKAAQRVSGLQAEVTALERLEDEDEGVEPAVQAAVAQAPVEVLGRLMDGVRGEPEVIAAVEELLGPLAQGLVVRTSADAGKLVHWFRTERGGKGGLYVLPLDRAGDPAAEGSLLARLEHEGDGAPWVRRLLGGVDLVDADALMGSSAGVRLSLSGASVDERGVVRVGRPQGTGGVHERRARLQGLRAELDEARPLAEEARTQRDARAAELDRLETGLEQARSTFLAAQDEERKARSDVQARSDERTRADRHREELARQLDGIHAAQQRAQERAVTSASERDRLRGEEEQLREARESAREALASVQVEWERARAEESELAVAFTRLEAEVNRIRERIESLHDARTSNTSRIEALATEASNLRSELEAGVAHRQEGEAELERLFEARDAATQVLRERDQAFRDAQEAVAEAERRVRQARAAEREATERRHRHELELQNVRSRLERLEERLETEWGKPFSELEAEATPVDGPFEELEVELQDIVQQLARIGPVNMLAVEEHEEESQRLEFLQGQHEDLTRARDDLRAAIKQINETATGLFTDTYEKIRENFRDTFQRLFQGGEADLWLADPDDPLESPIEIHASPRGKKTQRIDLLSGGERALTALSLLFGIYLVKPSPFCVLDEVDAPLDESNIGRFNKLLQDFKGQTQFVVITHNPRTIEAADWIYGVTMEEPGVSTIVGVQLKDALEVSGHPA